MEKKQGIGSLSAGFQAEQNVVWSQRGGLCSGQWLRGWASVDGATDMENSHSWGPTVPQGSLRLASSPFFGCRQLIAFYP